MERRDDELTPGDRATRNQLDPASSAIDELVRIRRGLVGGGERRPSIELPNLRIGFACKQRWEDMVGDDRVRACAAAIARCSTCRR